jgi:hypothetical protein
MIPVQLVFLKKSFLLRKNFKEPKEILVENLKLLAFWALFIK